MMEMLLIYCLIVWFVFYVLNHSDFLFKARNAVIPILHPLVAYSAQCSFCFTFWVGVGFYWFAGFVLPFVVAAPPIVLFINLIFLKLKPSDC